MIRRPPRSTPLSLHDALPICPTASAITRHITYSNVVGTLPRMGEDTTDRKSKRLNSSHTAIFRMPSFFFNDTATTEIYTSFPTRRSSDLPDGERHHEAHHLLERRRHLAEDG